MCDPGEKLVIFVAIAKNMGQNYPFLFDAKNH